MALSGEHGPQTVGKLVVLIGGTSVVPDMPDIDIFC